MRDRCGLAWAGLVLGWLLVLGLPAAAQAPTPKQEVWTLRDFKFQSGDVLP